jgi:hypothetical protein
MTFATIPCDTFTTAAARRSARLLPNLVSIQLPSAT